MFDDKTKQQIIEFIKTKKFFTAKRVSKELNIEPRLVGRVFIKMGEEGLVQRWNKKQWTWVET